MEIIYLLLPLSLCLALIALAGFFWGVRRNQFDDVDSASIRMLFDEASEETSLGTSAHESEDTKQ